MHIFAYLLDCDLVSAGQTCKKWQSISLDDCLWRRLLRVRYPPQQSLACDDNSPTVSCRDAYRTFKYDVPSVNVQEAKHHSDEVLHVSFSHNGRMVCSSSKDATACLWSVTPSYTLDLVETLVFKTDQSVAFQYTLYSEFNSDDSLLLVCGSVDHPHIRGMVNIYDIKQQTFVFRAVNRPYDFYSTWLGSRHFVYGDIEGANMLVGGTHSILYCSDVRGKVGSYKVLGRLNNGNGAHIRQVKSMPLGETDTERTHTDDVNSEGSDYRLLYCKGGSYVCGQQVACCNVTTDNIPQCSQQKEFIASAHSRVCETNARIIGTRLSPDNQFIYANCRSFLDHDEKVGLLGPDISQNVEVRVYRTDSLQQVQVLCGHKCYTPKNRCFIIFLDVSHNYVARSDLSSKY